MGDRTDKVYVVMVVTELTAINEDHACYNTYVEVSGVAMSVESANKRIHSFTFDNAELSHEGETAQGTIYRHFDIRDEPDNTIAVYVDIVDVI